jgi:DNA-binding NtrC family response regulator
MAKGKILVVDGDSTAAESAVKRFRLDGYQTTSAATAREAIDALERERWDLAVLDVNIPGGDGWELQSRIREADPQMPLILTACCPTVETAVRSFKGGASDFVPKPLNLEDLSQLAGRALDQTRAEREVARLRETLRHETTESDLIGQSLAMRKVIELVEMVASTDATVLITGEIGTGREYVARAIHAGSPRHLMPMLVIRCGGMNGRLLETELFGAEPGALPDTPYRKKGRFELADGGTVFLDEVSEIDAGLQSDLLRVLQEREIVRVGGSKPVKVDFRCVAASARRLDDLVRLSEFRPQLYYRLNAFSIDLPPLREHREDIPLLADHFLRKYAANMNRAVPKMSKQAMDSLLAYHWPGNVRELANAVERALLIRGEGVIQPEDFPFQAEGEPLEASQSLEEVERRHIEKVVKETNWNLSRTARILRIDRTTLYNKLRRYGLR